MASRRPVPLIRGAGDPAMTSDDPARAIGDVRRREPRLRTPRRAAAGPARGAGPTAGARTR
jgi:hypothetical protein